jgi:hypothetical protein
MSSMRLVALAVLAAACATSPPPVPPSPPLQMETFHSRYFDPSAERVIDRTNEIRGRVLLDGAPVTFFQVTQIEDATFMPGLLSSLGTPFLRPVVVHSADGRFHIEPKHDKANVLLISGPGFERCIVPAESYRGHGGDIEVSRGRRIEGFVRDETGAGVANARVTFSSSPLIAAHESSDPVEDLLVGKITVVTDARGHYVIEGAAPEIPWSKATAVFPLGPMQVRAWTPDHRLSSLPVSVGADDTAIDLSVRPTGTLQISSTATDLVLLSLDPTADPYMVIEAPYVRHGYTRWFRDLPVGDYKVAHLSSWSHRPIDQVLIQAGTLTTLVTSGTRR